MIYKNLEIKWLGHSGFKIKNKNINIYIDPFRLSNHVGEGDKADIIFITHSHYDHCCIEDIQKIAKNNTIIVCTPDCQSKFRHITQNIKIVTAEPEAKGEFPDFGIKYWTVRAYNINKNYHPREEDWVGYIIDFSGVLFYHAGDTDLISEMNTLKAIGVDVAFLPIGGTYTMNAGEAAKAAALIKPKLALPMHYLAIEGTGNKDDAEVFYRFCSEAGIEAKILEKS